MRSKKGRAAPLGRARKPRRVRNSNKGALEPLALELFGVAQGTLTQYGVSATEQRRYFAQAQRAPAIQRMSGAVLQQFRGLGDLISTWLEEMPYVDQAGKPKVLDIRGRGATFESLARQFLPEKPLADVVALACGSASVGTLPGGRIALYGDTLVDVSKHPEVALAQTILHIRQIVDTCLHNVKTPKDGPVLRRLERIVDQRISAADFEQFQKAIWPQLHDLCERVDRLLKSSAQKRPSRNHTRASAGIGLYVYFDDEMTREAHGGDADR